MLKKILDKIKSIFAPKQPTIQPDRRKAERRKGDRRWMSKLVGGPEVPYERRSGSDRRIGDRRKK